MERIKDVIGTNPEDLLDAITGDFAELVKYEALFTCEDYRESYLEGINRLYESLIRNCKHFLADLYRKEIENIFPERTKTLQEIDEEITNIKKTITVEKTRNS